jgi:DNA-binding response OmpR family regulator
MIKTVLHVDDDEDIRDIVRVALGHIGGLDIAQCGSGNEALQLLSEIHPDVILLDSMMPEMNGEQTFKELRKLEAGRSVPIVFVTAKVHEEAMRGFLDLGAAGVIVKPFDPLTLADDLRAICDRVAAR